MSTLLVCDDHRLVREALAALLLQVPGVTEVHQAASAEEVLARFAALRPDCVVMDARLPAMDGVTAAVRLLEEHPDARVLMLAAEISEDDELRVLRAGAKGSLSKDVDERELADAVHRILEGGDLVAPSLRRVLALHRPEPTLSVREAQVLQGMALGRTNAEIGQELWLSENTVKAHAKKLYAKTGLHDRSSVVAWGFRTKHLV